MMRINKRFKIIGIILVFVILASLVICLKFARMAQRPNILFITIDALRPDHLSCYGYKRNTSPNLDRFSKENLMFTQAISQSTFTPPSVSSILTSTYPSMHGVSSFGNSLKPGLITLPEILKENGYYLSLISGRGRLTEFLPELEKEFDTYIPSNADFKTADKVTQYAIKWLRANRKKRFFLWLFYLDPHASYRPPSPYNKMYVNDEFAKVNNKSIPIADESMRQSYAYKVIPRITAEKGITDVNYYISQYDGEISFTDSQIGRLLTELEGLGLYDNTVIIITSDHGESLGEHDFYFWHTHSVYEEIIRVPLIMRYKAIGENKIINRQVQSIDIMPTILDAAKIKTPKQARGTSLLPLIKKGKYNVRYAFSEVETGEARLKSIRTEDWKLIYNTKKNEYELYNLRDDPQELKNLVGTEKTQFRFLKDELHSWVQKTHSASITEEQVLDEATKEKLRSLGYL